MSDGTVLGQHGLTSLTIRGMVLAALAMALFSVQDAFVKSMAAHYAVVAVLFFRSTTALPLVAGYLWVRGGRAAFRSNRPGLQILRALLLFSMFISYYHAVQLLPLATVVALVFSAPLITTLLSIPILKEKVGPHRWAAVLVGFCGVLVMVQPGGGAFQWEALLCLLASVCYALAMVLTRFLGPGESLGSMVFYPNLVYLLGAGALLPAVWVPVALPDVALMMAFGLWTLLGHVTLTYAYRIAPPPALAPFDYTALVWAALWGWLFWDEIPSAAITIGAAIVVAAGLYALLRESRQGAKRPPPPPR